MKIIECEQRSVDWMLARAGVITASEFNQILTPKLEPRKGQMPETYMHKKLAEWWLGGPLATFNTFDMDQGQILEDEAIPWYEMEYGPVQRVGFITTDDGQVGCSPDGLLEVGGIEIKCPAIQTHFGYLLDGILPEDYAPQVHGSMYVTGAPQWVFLSYHRRTPPLLLTVKRDEAIQQRIAECLGKFLDKFEKAKAKLIEINGGPPRRATPKPAPTPAPDPEYVDIIP